MRPYFFRGTQPVVTPTEFAVAFLSLGAVYQGRNLSIILEGPWPYINQFQHLVSRLWTRFGVPFLKS
jgi:hypothetical protein